MQNKTFRLFISSTFNDFHREREILQTKVFPNIKEYAIKVGYSFQPIDLRWGVSDEAQLDQKTLELCLNEVRACKTNQYPNFLIMIGDRYGWIPLPYAIEEQEFNTLFSLMSMDEKSEIQQWYKLDLNQLPASYVLKERVGAFKEYRTWKLVEDRLKHILQTAVNRSSLTQEQNKKYFLSATEAEVIEGIFPYDTLTDFQKSRLLDNVTQDLEKTDHKHIFGFFRDIEHSSKQNNNFIIDDYDRAKSFKHKVKQHLDKQSVLHVKTQQLDENRLKEDYLQDFELKLTKFLIAQIDEQKKKEREKKLTSLKIELEAQSYFAQEKRADFIAQEEILKDIDIYINSENQEPLIVYGKSGIGKSSIIAQAIQDANKNTSKKIIYRFVGATPFSNSTLEVLTSLFEELGIYKESKDKISESGDDTEETFEQFSYRIYDYIKNLKEQVVIFIDAVDQLSNSDQFLWLPSDLPVNVKIIISALNDAKYLNSSKSYQILKEKININNFLEIQEFNKPRQLLYKLLKKENRTIQEDQYNYFLQQFKTANSPLYINIAAQELRYWKSYDYIEGASLKENGVEQDLKPTQQGVIKEFIDNLSEFYHHDEEFVLKVLGFLYASRDGLSEGELLELISTDKEFIKRVAPQEFHKNYNQELPLVHWSRLYTQLKPFLSLKTQNSEELIYFFHREFENIISELPNQIGNHESIIKSIEKLIIKNQDKEFDSNRWGKIYIILITEYELKYQNHKKQKVFLEFISTLENETLIESYLDNFLNSSWNYNLYNRMKEAIISQKLLLQSVQKLYNINPNRWVVDYNLSVNNLALYYSKINRSDEAIKLQEKNLTLCEEFYRENPDKWAHHYNRAVNNLALYYSKINRSEEAIRLQEKNLTLCEELYKTDSDKWVEDYSRAVNNLGQYYYNVNRIEEAIKLQENNLTLCEELYKTYPDMWAEDYNRAVNNLALYYSSVDRTDEAIKLQEKNLILCEELYKVSPDRWAEDYNRAVNNLALYYSSTDRGDEAIKLQEKNLILCEELYEIDSDKWAEDYSRAVNNLAQYYSNIDRGDDAIKLQEKNIILSQELYKTNPDRWAEDYNRAVDNLAVLYLDVERVKEAFTLREKSLKICEEYFKNNPNEWAKSYINSLFKLSLMYESDKRVDEMIALEEENNRVCEKYYNNSPNEWADDYFVALRNLALSYVDIDKSKEAILLREKNLTLCEKYYKINPEEWAKNHTDNLLELSLLYDNDDRADEVIILEKQNLVLCEKYYKINPDEWAESYSTALRNLAVSYVDVDSIKEAILLREKNLTLCEKYYKINPEGWVQNYSGSLLDLSLLYDDSKIDETITLEKKNLSVCEKYYNNDDEWAESYSTALRNLAVSYVSINKIEQAFSLREQNLALCEKNYKNTPDIWIEDYTYALTHLALSYRDKNQIEKAEELEEIAKINRKNL